MQQTFFATCLLMVTMAAVWMFLLFDEDGNKEQNHRSQSKEEKRGFVAQHINTGCKPTLMNAKYYSQSREDEALFRNYFNSPVMCGGVYVEIGALDGITYSNTKFFEDTLGWGGVLIEAQPDNAKKLKRNRSTARNKIIAEAVCPEGQTYVDFTGGRAVAGIPVEMTNSHIRHWFRGKFPRSIRVPCRPVGQMLRESGIEAIDFFILDVEGAELMVLETMDWSIPVKLFVVEMGRGDRDQLLIELLRSKGYEKTSWNIRGFCLPGRSCTNNQVFENTNYTYFNK